MTSRRILLIEDNPMNAELVGFILAGDAFDIETAGDASEALPLIERFRPELILMDIQLPGIDGLTLAQQLKASPATRDIVIVAFTAYSMKGDEERMLRSGCDGYISKPIDVNTFAAQVRACLERGCTPR